MSDWTPKEATVSKHDEQPPFGPRMGWAPSARQPFKRGFFAGLIGIGAVLFITAGGFLSYADDHHLQWATVAGVVALVLSLVAAIVGVLGLIAPRAINRLVGRSKIVEAEEPPLWPPPSGRQPGPQPEQSPTIRHEPAQAATAAHPPPRPQFYPAAPHWEPKPKRPYALFIAMLIGSVLAFPVAGLGILLVLALGEPVVTVTEAHIAVIAAAAVAGAAVVITAIVWAEQSRDLSRRARWIGWSLVVVAAVPETVGAVHYVREGSPQNFARPTVTGRAEAGSVLRADPGRWSSGGGRLSFDYQWQTRRRGSCTDILGATNRTYVARSRNLHRRIRVLVSAFSNGDDFSSDWVNSRATAVIRPSGEG
jgi:hypothetical protein